MKNDNYITGIGWMFNELKLSGNDAWVFALVYGFSQDGVSKFKGSINYICITLNISRRAVINILNKLEEKKLIVKHQTSINNVVFNEYSVCSAEIAPVVQKMREGSAETAQVGSAETAPNNTNIDNNSIKGFCAIDFFKKENPALFEQWMMKNKKRIKNFVMFINHFNYKFDEEGLKYQVNVIYSRLSRFADNWEATERKEAAKNKEEGVTKIKWS